MFESILGPIMIVVGLIGVLACSGMLAYSHWPRNRSQKAKPPICAIGKE